MKLIKFRIQNYKSIKDTGWCWLASDLTILAGKNESGKSAILEAIRDFNTDVDKIPNEALPLEDKSKPLIEMCFEVTKPMLNEIAQETEVTIGKETRDHITQSGFTISKLYDRSYGLEDEIDEALDKQINEANQQHIEKIQKVIKELSKIEQFVNVAEPTFVGSIDLDKQAVTGYIQQIQTQVVSITKDEEKKQIADKIEELKEENNALEKVKPSQIFLEEIVRYIPNFIFFSDFLDILPFELTFAEAKNNKTVQAFAKVSGLDLDEVIQTTDSQRRRNILSEHSATISGDFLNYWKQNKLDLIAEPDGEKLRLGVKELGKTMLFKPEQRSKGLQWFLSFYLRLNAEQGEINVILIDEPGLYLHAKAQKDVLKVLERTSQKSQVIFSTHSPYLIDAKRLDRVRLILKNEKDGTKIESKIHKGVDANNETLTPIITAIGLDIANSFSIVGKKNVLLEGISDYYFMQALRKYIKSSEGNLIPCVGAQKIPLLISLLIGWDLEFLAVLDNDTEGKRIAKILSIKLLVEGKKIIFIAEKDGSSIEDLFTHKDFNDFVLNENKNDDTNLSNSRFIKDKKYDKVLLSKKFFEKVEENQTEIKLSQDTINAFKQVFNKISNGFK
jgi:predicted ATP-dependent endonuclease of OLD family